MDRIRRATEWALASGALEPIATETAHVDAEGARFLVRILTRLERKERAGGDGGDPFQDPPDTLIVGELSPTHRCLLNRFNVLEHHLLIVTRRFVHQLEPLDRGDMDALAHCLDEINGLGFYNGGRTAGASQDHKHLQLVPLPLSEATPPVPIEPLLGERGSATCSERLPFRHALRWLEPGDSADGARLLRACRDAACEASVGPTDPYNLLVTRRWLMLVPRSREHFGDMSVNALGFAGSLLVRNREGLDAVRRAGPLRVLASVSVPPPA